MWQIYILNFEVEFLVMVKTIINCLRNMVLHVHIIVHAIIYTLQSIVHMMKRVGLKQMEVCAHIATHILSTDTNSKVFESKQTDIKGNPQQETDQGWKNILLHHILSNLSNHVLW